MAGNRQSYCKKIAGLLFGPPCTRTVERVLFALMTWNQAESKRLQSDRSSWGQATAQCALLHWRN